MSAGEARVVFSYMTEDQATIAVVVRGSSVDENMIDALEWWCGRRRAALSTPPPPREEPAGEAGERGRDA